MDKSITSPDYRLFLQELRVARKRSGLTQEEVADRLEETQTFVSKCERGERRMDVVELRAYCRAIGLTLPSFTHQLERALAGAANAKGTVSGRRHRSAK